MSFAHPHPSRFRRITLASPAESSRAGADPIGERGKSDSFLHSRRAWWGAACLLVLAIIGVYLNSFSVPFHFDDGPAIVDNSTIGPGVPMWKAVFPPRETGTTVNGRPLLNLSLAFNYALGGTSPPGYHAVNLALHLCAALTLFGVVRRTLLRARPTGRFGLAALPLAWVVALLWSLHPLQTESVTYIVQRAESLAAFFYLLTLYAFIRGMDAPRPTRWLALSIICCLLGLATKETVVTAPLIIFLYDRSFVAESFSQAWRARSRYYGTLAATWIMLAGLVFSTANRGGTAGFGHGVSSWDYLLTQCEAIVRYLRLTVWPRHQVFDYGMGVVHGVGEVWPQMLFLLGLLAIVAVGMRRFPQISFVAASFFILLAPSSSIVPVTTQTIAEHRVYLPLAALVVLGVLAVYAWLGPRSIPVFLAVALGLGLLTVRRNAIYSSELVLWRDCVVQRPDNARAQNNLGRALVEADDIPGALFCFATALRLLPDYPETHNNLGYALAKTGKVAEAVAHFEESLRIRPGNASAHDNLGNALIELNRSSEAMVHFEEALRLKPTLADAHWGLGNALSLSGLTTKASAQYKEALRLDPAFAEAHYGLGMLAAQSGHTEEAIARYRDALRLRPAYPEAYNNLGNQLVKLNQIDEALASYRSALVQRPSYFEARTNLANALLEAGHVAESISEYREVLRSVPNNPEVRCGLGNALAQADQLPEAIEAFRQTLALQADYVPARANLGNALLLSGRVDEAIVVYQEALRLTPDDASLRANLAQARSLEKVFSAK